MAPYARRKTLSLLSLLLSTNSAWGKEDNNDDGKYYDSCVSTEHSPKNLTPNTFHKICPEATDEKLGQPICGDGTSFSFAYTSPTQRKSNEEKIVIEFQGGGACWDDQSCAQAGDRLSFPDSINNFIGYSCSAAAYGSGNVDGYPINFLCDTTIGDTDLSNYHYILVPYCTQDVHLGDNTAYYEEGETTYHHGAHNMMSVLRWVYQHFSNPSHILLTGCSAGGSPLPVVYDLVYHHYNSFLKGGRTVNINTIMDSAVYLTPKYFLNNGMPNWNVETILNQVKFNTEQEQSVQYSTYLWKHAIKRGSRNDKWGFLSHTNDPVSIAYWQAMGAGYYGDDDQNNNNDCDSWYSDMSQSLGSVQSTFKNAETYYMDGQGHCSLGLYYGMQDEGFDEWAGAIVKEQIVLKRSNESVPLFMMSLSVGAVLMTSALLWKSKLSIDKNGPLMSDEMTSDPTSLLQRANKVLAPLLPMGKRFEKCPFTTFYFVTTTLYFMCMMIDGGFTHPLNNPSLGPSATVLSKFGINNPTLIADKKQIFRLVSSSFMCSGVLTYIIVTLCVFKCLRHAERASDNTPTFTLSALCVMLGSNLIYACFGSGASCGSVGFVLGMNAFSFGLSKKLVVSGLTRPTCSTIFLTIVAMVLFPFNSWILILSALVIGAFLPCVIMKQGNQDFDDTNVWMSKPAELSKTVHGFTGVFAIIFILILAGVPNPNELYQYPYLTGCKMMYSTDLAQFFGGRRLGDGFDYNNIGCAQFCVPHLVEKPFYYGLKKYASYSEDVEYSVEYGLCEQIGYDEHIADTTFEYMKYPLDVEVYNIGQDD